MIKHISKYEFIDTFLSSDTYKNNFSYEGLSALFDYLEELEDSTGQEMEFDMVGLCCDYSEEKKIEHIAENYEACNDMSKKQTRDWLKDRTTLIEFDGGVIYQQF